MKSQAYKFYREMKLTTSLILIVVAVTVVR